MRPRTRRTLVRPPVRGSEEASMSESPKPSAPELAWQVVILVLSVVTIVFVAVDTVFELTDETSRLFFLIDFAVCFVFLGDVFYRGVLRPDRGRWWRWGWIDLLSSIPAVAFLRWGRLLRIVRIVRVLRAFRSSRAIVGHLFQDPARGSVVTVALATITLIAFGSIAILNVEGAHGGTNIATAEDALWWAFVTVTTVGYGDHFPVTGAGRLVAALLMAAGVGLFGTLTAYLANAWLLQSAASEEEPANDADRTRDDVLAERLARIEGALARLEEASSSREPPA